MCLALGHMPPTWCTTKVVALQKLGKKDYSTSRIYRPINMLSTMEKFLEKIMCKRPIGFLKSRHLLLHYQFGFRWGRHGGGLLLVDGGRDGRVLLTALGLASNA